MRLKFSGNIWSSQPFLGFGDTSDNCEGVTIFINECYLGFYQIGLVDRKYVLCHDVISFREYI